MAYEQAQNEQWLCELAIRGAMRYAAIEARWKVNWLYVSLLA
jgi:hypothetical protein